MSSMHRQSELLSDKEATLFGRPRKVEMKQKTSFRKAKNVQIRTKTNESLTISASGAPEPFPCGIGAGLGGETAASAGAEVDGAAASEDVSMAVVIDGMSSEKNSRKLADF